MPPVLAVLLITVVIAFFTEFASNTATIIIFLPVLAELVRVPVGQGEWTLWPNSQLRVPCEGASPGTPAALLASRIHRESEPPQSLLVNDRAIFLKGTPKWGNSQSAASPLMGEVTHEATLCFLGRERLSSLGHLSCQTSVEESPNNQLLPPVLDQEFSQGGVPCTLWGVSMPHLPPTTGLCVCFFNP